MGHFSASFYSNDWKTTLHYHYRLFLLHLICFRFPCHGFAFGGNAFSFHGYHRLFVIVVKPYDSLSLIIEVHFRCPIQGASVISDLGQRLLAIIGTIESGTK